MPGRLEPDAVKRRDFLGLAGMFTAGVTLIVSLLGMGRMLKPLASPEASAVARLGKPDEYPPGTAKLIPEYKVRIVSTEEGVAAISLVCTHLGCIINEVEEGFHCPCHSSKFDYDGNVTGGPAPRPLAWLAISKAPDGSLMVDTKSDVGQGTYYAV